MNLNPKIIGKFRRNKETFSSIETRRLTRTAHPKVDWHRSILFQFNTPKYSFMAWIAIQNKLPTDDRISNRNFATTTTCCLFPAILETRNHMFFQCFFSEEIWRNLTHKLLRYLFEAMGGNMKKRLIPLQL